jgi:hypothetical protein
MVQSGGKLVELMAMAPVSREEIGEETTEGVAAARSGGGGIRVC